MREITFCLNCKSNVEEDALFCSVCGEEQELTQKNQLDPSTSFESKQKR